MRLRLQRMSHAHAPPASSRTNHDSVRTKHTSVRTSRVLAYSISLWMPSTLSSSLRSSSSRGFRCSFFAMSLQQGGGVVVFSVSYRVQVLFHHVISP